MGKMLWSLGFMALTAAEAPPVDRIVVMKSARTLTLYAGSHAVRTYKNIRLGETPVGPKHFEHDGKTPEGSYIVNGRNAGSHYHLSLRISYPNAEDRAYAARAHRAPGGDIFIHGLPNWYPAPFIPNDWTDGCVALTNPEMEEVWRLVKVGTPVIIKP